MSTISGTPTVNEPPAEQTPEAEPKKGRGRPDAKDEKPGNGKSKQQQRDLKP